jgi:hypothetical protein
MTNRHCYNTSVSARIQFCEAILGSEALLAAYEAHGGLRKDLEQISAEGHRASACDIAQSRAAVFGSCATTEAVEGLATLRREHSRLMAVLELVRRDLAGANASAEVLATLDAIRANDAQRVVVTVPGEATRRRKASRSYEAIRAEIQRDASALLALTEARETLASRKFDQARLERLLADAQSLSGKLAEKTSKAGSRQAATAEEHVAVKAQSEIWAASYPIFAAVARENVQFAELLKMATR